MVDWRVHQDLCNIAGRRESCGQRAQRPRTAAHGARRAAADLRRAVRRVVREGDELCSLNVGVYSWPRIACRASAARECAGQCNQRAAERVLGSIVIRRAPRRACGSGFAVGRSSNCIRQIEGRGLLAGGYLVGLRNICQGMFNPGFQHQRWSVQSPN